MLARRLRRRFAMWSGACDQLDSIGCKKWSSIRGTMRYVIAVFALAGAVVSFLALQVHYSTSTSPCSINEKWDCGIVKHSSYAVIEGIPVALIGILGYLAISWLGFARQKLAVLIASSAGLAFSLYLTRIE